MNRLKISWGTNRQSELRGVATGGFPSVCVKARTKARSSSRRSSTTTNHQTKIATKINLQLSSSRRLIMLQKSSSAHGLRAYYHSFLPVQMECHTSDVMGSNSNSNWYSYIFVFVSKRSSTVAPDRCYRWTKARSSSLRSVRCNWWKDDIVERLKIPPVFLNPTRNDHRLSVCRRALPLSLAPMYTTRHLYSTSNQQGLTKEMLISKDTRRISDRMSVSYLYSFDLHFNRLKHRGILDRSQCKRITSLSPS